MDHNRKKELSRQYQQRREKGGVFLIRCETTGQGLLLAEPDWEGSRNRHQFSLLTGDCQFSRLREDWKRYGAKDFTFQLLEELEKKPEQTPGEFREDLETLRLLWAEKLGPQQLYL